MEERSMKNRTVLARLAALGMSIALCFGVVACGEKEDSSERSRTEKEAEEEDEKEEDVKEENEKDEEDEKKEETEKKEEPSEKEVGRESNKKEDAAAQGGKEESTAATSDSEAAGHYVSKVDLGEDYFLEQMGTTEMGDMADMFKGADFSFEATLDLNKDGTGVLGFDLERFYGNMYDFMDEHYIDMMKAAFETMGFSDEELLDMLKEAGYKTLDEALEDYKKEAMEEFDQQMRDNSSDAANSTLELTWEEDGDTIQLINEEGRKLSVDRQADGSLIIEMPASQSPTGSKIEMVFVK